MSSSKLICAGSIYASQEHQLERRGELRETRVLAGVRVEVLAGPITYPRCETWRPGAGPLVDPENITTIFVERI